MQDTKRVSCRGVHFVIAGSNRSESSDTSNINCFGYCSMNEVDRQILSFMRDVREPAQRNFSAGVIDDNIKQDVRERHLELLAGRGLVNKSVPPEDSQATATTYWLSAEGMQAIITEDLNQTLDTTNKRLSQTRDELRLLQESQSRSAAVQTIFSVTIILFTTYQILSSAFFQEAISKITIGVTVIGVVLAGLVILFGLEPLTNAVKNIK